MAVTLSEVAHAAGVSISTASLAFSGAGPIAEATRERVLAAAQRLGYQGPNPTAASLRTGRSGVIGVVVDHDLRYSFRDPVSVQILDGISGELGGSGYGVLLIPRTDAGGAPHPLLGSAAIDAAIMFYGVLPDDRAIETLRRRRIPMISMGGSAEGVTVLRVDERSGMRAVAEHLLAGGHERIALAALPYGARRRSGRADPAATPAHAVTAGRLQGVLDAGVTPVAVWECAGSLVDEGMAAGNALLDLDPVPTAIIGFSDLIAAGVVLAARERGIRVPEDLAVAGFDGVDLPWLSGHTLTTVDQPRRDRGALAATLAIEAATGSAPADRLMGVSLRVGTTT